LRAYHFEDGGGNAVPIHHPGFCMAALADMLLVLVRRLRWIGVEDDPL
jgi:hypothetical protein